jgi:hypothetical protein
MIFIESPWPAIGIGAVLFVLFGARFTQTKQVKILAAMIAIVAATIGMVIVERLVVTEREAVENLLDTVARATEMPTRDIDRIVESISPSNTILRARARGVLPRHTINGVRIKDLAITLDMEANPPQAQATAHVFITIGAITHDRHVTVHLVREPVDDGGASEPPANPADANQRSVWRIRDYRESRDSR